MTTTRFRSASAVAFSSLLVAYAGCRSSRESEKPEAVPATTPAPSPAAAEDEWGPNARPLAAVAVTGQQHGYLEPCGCTDGQTGGLGRRETLLADLRDDGIPLVPVDLGGLVDDPAKSRGGPDQVRIKLETALKALQQLGYKAIALAPEDLRIGVAEFFGQYLNIPDAPPLLAANVLPVEGLGQALRPSIVVEAGPRRVGLTAVVDPAALDEAAADEKDAFFSEVLPPADALARVLPELEQSSDIQVLLVQGPESLARELAEKFPALDAIIPLSVYVDPPIAHAKLNDGKTLLVQVGQKGQNVGLVGLFGDTARPVRYRRENLGPDLENGPEMLKLVSETYTQALATADVLGNYPRFPHPSGAKYVGVETCKQCHPRTVEFWSTTRHARAWQGVLHGPRGDRRVDAECVSCHTTGFGYESGFIDEARSPLLLNQQCENCHGPGSNHVSDPDNAEFLKQISLTADLADRTGVCARCHDADNDPHYDFKLRWPAVAHKGLDTYASPRVHKGLDVDAILQSLSSPPAGQ